MSFTDLNSILDKAKVKNSTLNITGCLIYHGGRFVQILEGNQKEVQELFDSIKVDKRHENVTLLWENHAKRFFDDWSMAFYQPEENNVKEFINNLILFSELTEKTTGSLLSFWATVRRMLSDGKSNF